MSDSIKINNDVKLTTRYALGYTPEEQPYSVDPSVFCYTVGIEKGLRGAMAVFPEAMTPKASWQKQKTLEQSLKGADFNETYNNYRRSFEVQELERRFRPLSANELKEIKKIEDFEKFKKLSTEAKNLTGSAKAAKMAEVKRAFTEFQRSQGFSNAREAANELKKLKGQKYTTLQKRLSALRKTQYYDDVRRLVDEAKNLRGTDYANKMKEVQKAIAEANLKVHTETTKGALKAVTKRGKLWNGVKNISGYNKAKESVQTILTKSPKLQGFSKFARSNALTAVSIDLALSIPEIIETKNTFDQVDENGNPVYDENGKQIEGRVACGTEKAVKQTGRTLAIAGTQVAAYAVGAQMGTAAVAALWAAKGAALGSVAPGIGTAIGAVVGLAAGLIMSHYAGKVAQKVFGKSELDQMHDKVANNLSAKAIRNDEVLAEVMTAAEERLASEPEDSENIEKVTKSYNNIVEAYNAGQIGTASTTAQAGKTEKPQKELKANTPVAKSETKPEETKPTAETKTKDKATDKYKNTLSILAYYINSLDSMASNGGFNFNSGMNMNTDMSSYMQFNSPFMNYNNMNQWEMQA